MQNSQSDCVPIIRLVNSYRKQCATNKDWDGHMLCHVSHRWILYDALTGEMIPVESYPGTTEQRISAYLSDARRSNEHVTGEDGLVITSELGRKVIARKFISRIGE